MVGNTQGYAGTITATYANIVADKIVPPHLIATSTRSTFAQLFITV